MRRPSVATRGEGAVVAATTGIVRHGGARPQPAIDMSLTVLEGNTFFVCDDDGNAAHGSEGLYAERRPLRLAVADDARRPAAEAARHRRAGPLPRRVVRLQGDLRRPRRARDRDAAPLLRLRRHVPGGARGRQQRPRDGHRARALRVRLRLPRPLRGQVAGVRPARPRLRQHHHAAADRAALRRTTRTATPSPSCGEPLPGQRADLVLRARRAGRPRDRLRDRARPARALAAAGARRPARAAAERADRYPTRTSAPSAGASRSPCASGTTATPVLDDAVDELGATYDQTLDDLAALRMRRVNGAGELPAAGLPWFATVFGRDTAIVGLQTMSLGQDLAREALRDAGRLAERRRRSRRRTPSPARSCTSCASARSRR